MSFPSFLHSCCSFYLSCNHLLLGRIQLIERFEDPITKLGVFVVHAHEPGRFYVQSLRQGGNRFPLQVYYHAALVFMYR